MQSQTPDLDDSQDPLYQGFTLKQQHFQSPEKQFNSRDSFRSLPLRQQSSMGSYSEDSLDKYQPQIKKLSIQEKRISFHPNNIDETDVKLKKEQERSSQVDILLNKNHSKYRRKTLAKIGLSNEVWKKQGLKILFFIARFVLVLLFSIKKIKLRMVDRKIFTIIGDNSTEYEYYRARKLLKDKPTITDKLKLVLPFWFLRFCNYSQESFEKIVVIIKPDSPFKIVYDVILMIVISFTVFFAPLQFCFSINLYEQWLLLFETLPAYIYLVEIFFNFNSSYYKKGQIITSRKQIIKHYLKGNFIWDVLLTTLLFLKNKLPSGFTLFLIFRVYRIEAIFNQLVIVLNLRDRFSQVLSLIKLIYLLQLVSHLIACFLYYIGEFQLVYLNQNESWLTEYEIFDKDWVTKYITSLYWAIITTTTVGYGDINPLTQIEKVCIIFVTLLSSVVFGYMISSIGAIFSQLKEQDEVYLNKMAQINAYIKSRNLSQPLQLKLRMYFEYYLKQSGNEEEIQMLINSISPELQKEVKIDFYEKYLKNVLFIKESVSNETLQKLCMVVKERKLQPEEVLLKSSEMVDKVFIILNGQIELYVDKGNQQKAHLKYLKTGEVLYEKNFICELETEHSSRATNQSVILELNRNELIEILKQNDEDYQKFCMIKENLIFNQNYKLIQHNCEICNYKHELKNCPFIFFQLNQERIFRKHRKQTQTRLAQHRQHRAFPSFRVCRLDYLDSAITLALEILLIDDNEINDEFLENVGFPMKNQETILRKAEDLVSSSSSDESTEKQNVIKEVENENSSSESSKCEDIQAAPNFQVMKQVRKYSILNNNVDPRQLQAKRGLIHNRRTSRDIGFFKGRGNFSLKSQFSNSNSSDDKQRRNLNLQDIYKKNFDKRESIKKESVEQIIQIQEDCQDTEYKMLDQLKIEYDKKSEQTVFTDCDQMRDYCFYFTNFNLNRVIQKYQVDNQKRKKLLSKFTSSEDINWRRIKEKTLLNQKTLKEKLRSNQTKRFDQTGN